MNIHDTMQVVSTTGTSAPVPSDSDLRRAKYYTLNWLRRYHGYKGEMLKGLRNDWNECPVARMLTTAHNREYRVDGEGYDFDAWELPKRLPYWAVMFTAYFDEGYYPELEGGSGGP